MSGKSDKPALSDSITVSKLEVFSSIGATASERAVAQRLTVSLEIWPCRGFERLGDSLVNTVDYAGVCDLVRKTSAAESRNLLETLADDLAKEILAAYRVQRVKIEVRKYVFPDTEFVGVRLQRERMD